MSNDDLEDYIRRKLEEGIEVTAEDFRGRRCAYCGDWIEFVDVLDDPDALVPWDVPVADPETGESEDIISRTYFCSEQCKHDAQRDMDWLTGEKEQYGEDDRFDKERYEEGLRNV